MGTLLDVFDWVWNVFTNILFIVVTLCVIISVSFVVIAAARVLGNIFR